MLCRCRIRGASGLGCCPQGVVFDLELAIGILETSEASLGLAKGLRVRINLSRNNTVSHDCLKAVQFLGALVEMVLEGLVFPPEVLFDRFNLTLKATNDGLDHLDCGKEILAESGKHGGYGLETGQGSPIDEAVVVGPVGAAESRQAGPQQEKEVIALGELVLECVFEL